MTSRWEGVPLDIIRQQFEYLNNSDEIEALCGDPYIFDKLCQDENGGIWEYLYRRDFSDHIKVRKGNTLKKLYLKTKDKLNNIDTIPYISKQEEGSGVTSKSKKINNVDMDKFHFAIENGYEKILPTIDFSKIPENNIRIWLNTAAGKCRFEIVKFLLENVIDFNSPRINKIIALESILARATDGNCLEIIDYIINNYDNFDLNQPFLIAVINGYLPIMEYLFNKGTSDRYMGVDIQYQNNKALRYALQRERFPVIKFLLENGADFNVIAAEAASNPTSSTSDFIGKNLSRFQKYLPTLSSANQPVSSVSSVSSKSIKSPKRKIPKAKIPSSKRVLSPKSEDSSIRCVGSTKSGQQCCRTAKDGSQYCFQHQE